MIDKNKEKIAIYMSKQEKDALIAHCSNINMSVNAFVRDKLFNISVEKTITVRS